MLSKWSQWCLAQSILCENPLTMQQTVQSSIQWKTLKRTFKFCYWSSWAQWRKTQFWFKGRNCQNAAFSCKKMQQFRGGKFCKSFNCLQTDGAMLAFTQQTQKKLKHSKSEGVVMMPKFIEQTVNCKQLLPLPDLSNDCRPVWLVNGTCMQMFCSCACQVMSKCTFGVPLLNLLELWWCL